MYPAGDFSLPQVTYQYILLNSFLEAILVGATYLQLGANRGSCLSPIQTGRSPFPCAVL